MGGLRGVRIQRLGFHPCEQRHCRELGRGRRGWWLGPHTPLPSPGPVTECLPLLGFSLPVVPIRLWIACELVSSFMAWPFTIRHQGGSVVCVLPSTPTAGRQGGCSLPSLLVVDPPSCSHPRVQRDLCVCLLLFCSPTAPSIPPLRHPHVTGAFIPPS